MDVMQSKPHGDGGDERNPEEHAQLTKGISQPEKKHKADQEKQMRQEYKLL